MDEYMRRGLRMSRKRRSRPVCQNIWNVRRVNVFALVAILSSWTMLAVVTASTGYRRLIPSTYRNVVVQYSSRSIKQRSSRHRYPLAAIGHRRQGRAAGSAFNRKWNKKTTNAPLPIIPSSPSQPFPDSSVVPISSTERLRSKIRRLTSNVISGIGFASSTTVALVSNQSQLRRWKASVKALETFLKKTGIDLEISQSLTARLLDHTVVLGRIQKATLENGTDIRDRTLSQYHPGQEKHSYQRRRAIPKSQRPTLPPRDECLRYAKYATAVYGESMIRAAEVGVSGKFDSRMSPLTRTRISEHVGVPEKDIVLIDVDYDGDSNHLRHFVAVDHANRKVVLAIRGTFSLSEFVVDVAGFTRPFCGGEAHAEMANMVEQVWDMSKTTVRRRLLENKGYEFIITGHSLGAGVASLLNILCHRRGGKEVGGRSVRCFAYACPPVFAPMSSARDAARHCTNFIHERDCVPFLSVDSVRHFFAQIRAISEQDRVQEFLEGVHADEARQKIGWWNRMKLVTGYADPDEALIRAVDTSNHKRLPPKPGAPHLIIPAELNLWIRRKARTGTFDVKICDSEELAKLGIQIDPNMLVDHFPPVYERALHNLE